MKFTDAFDKVICKLEGTEHEGKVDGCASVDVVICTRDRYGLLPKAVAQVKQRFPYNHIIIVDSSPCPNCEVLQMLGNEVSVVFTPDARLGYARQIGLLNSTTPIVGFIDDDLLLEVDWYGKMYASLMSDEKALAASSKVVFGYKTDATLMRLHLCSLRGEGASIGVALLKRREVLALGGFNVRTHRGEDAELELKMKSKGYKWLRVPYAVAFHPLTFPEYMQKAKDNVEGWMLIWNYSKHRTRFLVERTGSWLLMPVYYGFLTKSFKVAYYYFRFKFVSLVTFLRRIKPNVRLAVDKLKCDYPICRECSVCSLSGTDVCFKIRKEQDNRGEK